MDRNEFKLRQALLGENGAIARFHQQITDARQPNIPFVYLVINRQKVKINKSELSRWLRSTSYFRHLSHLRTDNQFLEAVFNDPNLPRLAQRPERVLSPNVINTLVAMTHLNEFDQDQALKELVDQEEQAQGKLDYIPERSEKVNQALNAQIAQEQKSSENKTDRVAEPERRISVGSTTPPSQLPPDQIQVEEVTVDRTDPLVQETITTPTPIQTQQIEYTTGESLPRQSFFRSVVARFSPRNAPSFLKDIGSKGQILASKALKNPMVVSTAVGGLSGGALGLGITGTAQGGLLGSLAGGALPMASKSGALGSLLGIGGKGAAGLAARGGLAAAGLASGPVGWAALAASLAPQIKDLIKKQVERNIKSMAFVIALIFIILIVLFLVLMSGGMDLLKTNSLFPPFEQNIGGENPDQTQNRLTVSKKGTAATQNRGDVQYQISVTYQGKGRANITVVDKLPDTIEFVDATEGGTNQKTPPEKAGGGTVTWKINELSAGSTKLLTVNAKALAEADNTWLVNQAEATIDNVVGQNVESINQCTFTRSGQSAPIKSQTLAGFIEEVASKTGLPASLLAGIAMHENQGFVTNAADTHDAFNSQPASTTTSCKHFATSPTGALGLMQVQPPQTVLPTARGDAHDAAGVRKGAEFLGKPYESLTMEDFCDVKSSLYLGAGVILSKSGFQIPQTNEQIKNAVCRYYGQCDYGGHNYGQEVVDDLNRCVAATEGFNSPMGAPTRCEGATANFNVTKKLLPTPEQNNCSQTLTRSCGRPNRCVIPRTIVIHTTASPLGANETYDYFARGADGRGVGSHFIIGKGGETLQLVEMLEDQAEVAYAVAGYSNHISIELTHPGVYQSKAEMPPAQYTALLNLVKALMQQYQIPVSSLTYTWKANNGASDSPSSQVTPGIYGHYQLNPTTRTDPGNGLMRDLIGEL